jgi:RNA polymerase-binding transcription factor DksA
MVKNTTKTTRFDREFLEKIKKILLEERAKLENELALMTKKTSDKEDGYATKFPNYGDNEDENAAEVAEYVTNISLEENLQKNLRDTEQALARVDQGTYGICKYCKKTIEEKRLLARPASSACVECKKAIVQEA